jgi:hypothetical protein
MVVAPRAVEGRQRRTLLTPAESGESIDRPERRQPVRRCRSLAELRHAPSSSRACRS